MVHKNRVQLACDLSIATGVRHLRNAAYLRKLTLAHPGGFPAPVHEGSASIWHLADVLVWLQAKGGYAVAGHVLEVVQVAMHVNIAKEQRRIPRRRALELED